MINISEKAKCCGCRACENACRFGAISMSYDESGFIYPQVDPNKCTNCNLCETVCPIINDMTVNSVKPSVFAGISKEKDILEKSSSGGAFFILARYIIQQNGIVFGAKFDGFHLRHSYTDNINGLYAFMGSKYIQCDTDRSYVKVLQFLKENRLVLYSGMPCQIAGLKRFLKKNYDNLITIDLLCHGVPSPGIWEKYMQSRFGEMGPEQVKEIRFRNKRNGVSYFFFFFFLDKFGKERKMMEASKKNAYYSMFLHHIFRPSCYDCKFRSIDSYSDFTIGDCWNAPEDHPNMDYKNGISTIICHTEKSKIIFEEVKNLFITENENPSIMIKRFDEYSKETIEDKNTKPWRLFYEIQPRFPLQLSRVVFEGYKETISRIIKNNIFYKTLSLCKRSIKLVIRQVSTICSTSDI